MTLLNWVLSAEKCWRSIESCTLQELQMGPLIERGKWQPGPSPGCGESLIQYCSKWPWLLLCWPLFLVTVVHHPLYTMLLQWMSWMRQAIKLELFWNTSAVPATVGALQEIRFLPVGKEAHGTILSPVSRNNAATQENYIMGKWLLKQITLLDHI